MVGFTQLSSRKNPQELVDLLNEMFSAFDRLTDRYGLEKIKTIGDAYRVAGVIGTKKFLYDLWADAVNVASLMESQGIPGCIQVTKPTYPHLKDRFCLEERGEIAIKGKGTMTAYLLRDRHSDAADFMKKF